jgi:hypothetical protein
MAWYGHLSKGLSLLHPGYNSDWLQPGRLTLLQQASGKSGCCVPYGRKPYFTTPGITPGGVFTRLGARFSRVGAVGTSHPSSHLGFLQLVPTTR